MYNPAPIHAPIGRSASPIPGIVRSRSPAVGILRNRSPAPPESHTFPSYSNPATLRPLSRGPSPAPGIIGSGSPNISGFQVEKRARSPNPYGRQMPQPEATSYREETLFRDHISALIAAKDLQFAANGRIPVDPAQLVLFFRSRVSCCVTSLGLNLIKNFQTGVAHSLDFPIDVSYNTPPALDVLIAACRPHPAPDYGSYGGQQALFYPTNLPLTTTLDISNFPILDAIRNSLFPDLPPGQYLTSIVDRLDVVENGSRLITHSPAQLRNDARAATIVITLPVRHRGGALVVRDVDGREERFQGTGGKSGDLDWIALRSDCTYEIEPVQKGVFVSVLYGVFIKSFGPASTSADTLVTPTDSFFNFLSPILNTSRGKIIAFYLNHDYNANPAEVVANTLVSQVSKHLLPCCGLLVLTFSSIS